MRPSNRSRIAGCGALLLGTPLGAQITVNPTGVNVASQGATTVFLTFGGLTPVSYTHLTLPTICSV